MLGLMAIICREMVVTMLLPGILRSARPFNLMHSMCSKNVLASSAISSNHYCRKSLTVRQESFNHYQKLVVNVPTAYLSQVRSISIKHLDFAKEEDIKKAVKKEVKKEAEKIVKENVDKKVGNLAKAAKVDGAKVKVAAEKIIEQKKEDPDYSKIYHFRHLINISLLAVIPACLIGNSPATDYLFVVVVFLHNHFSFENIINDYLSENMFGETLPKATQIISIIISLFILVGLVNLIQNDIGIAQTFHCLWKVGKKDIQDEIDRVQRELEEAAKNAKK